MVGCARQFRLFHTFGEQTVAADRREAAGKSEVSRVVGIGRRAHTEHKVADTDVRFDCACSSDADDILHSEHAEQFIGIDTHRRHSHSACHNRDALAVVSSGIALHASDIIDEFCVLQPLPCDHLRPQGVARHQDRTRKICGGCGDMRRRIQFRHVFLLLRPRV